ncbi:MAG: HAD hydrolase-like protein [Chloroflexi bacterium]|nr:HAD hydrolase-like protein [Chloroflexota bacterium]
MAYKLIVFDFDGTLANSFPWVLGILDELAKKFNTKPLDPTQLEQIKNYSPRVILEMHNVPLWKLPSILKFTRARMRTHGETIKIFEGVDLLLQALSERNIRLAIVTTNTRETVRRVLGEELFELFHYLEDRVSIFGKPAALRKIIRKSGYEKVEMLSIGDEIRDLEAAQIVHIPFGAVSWGFSSLEALSQRFPSHTFTNMQQILEVVDAFA